MLRGDFDLAAFAWLLNVAALVFGAGLGARALFDPNWAAKFVRLKADETQSGGFAEFRATYGGVFLALHGAALTLSLHWIVTGEPLTGLYATGAALVIALAWAGAAGGRGLSMLRDGTRTRFNTLSMAVEATMALLIVSPWVVWVFSRA